MLLPHRCANDLNLARMVVDQRDLVEGRELGPARAAPVVGAIERYKAGQIRELQIERAGEQ
jgi:type IV pilus biogenesis protein CpaD/CtpE